MIYTQKKKSRLFFFFSGIDERHLKCGMLRGDGIAFEQQDHSRIVHPFSQNRFEREAAAAQIIVQIFLLDWARTLKGNLVSLVANVKLRDIALLGEFDALFVGK